MRTLILACLAWLWLCAVWTPATQARGEPSTSQVASPSQLQPVSLREPMTPPVERVWYGWQTVLADLASGSVLLGLAATDASAAPIWIAFATWGLAAPAIHVAHGNYAQAAASTAMRAGGATLSLIIAVFAVLGGGDSTPALILGPVASFIAIMAIDAGGLAYGTRAVKRDESSLRVAPFVDRGSRTTGLALVGTL